MVEKIAWQDRAACKDQPVWTNQNGETEVIDFFSEIPAEQHAAKAVCFSCPVRKECLTDALSSEDRFGIWGGADENMLRRALSIDQYGHPTVRIRQMKCPFCQKTNLTHKHTTRVKTYITCDDCSLGWWSRKKTEIMTVDADEEQEYSDNMDGTF